MSRAAQRRQVIRWARYLNHYGHIDGVLVGGRSVRSIVWRGLLGGPQDYFLYVRRQAKHRFGESR